MTKKRTVDGPFDKVKVEPFQPSKEAQAKNEASMKKGTQAHMINRLVGDKGMTITDASAAAAKALK